MKEIKEYKDYKVMKAQQDLREPKEMKVQQEQMEAEREGEAAAPPHGEQQRHAKLHGQRGGGRKRGE